MVRVVNDGLFCFVAGASCTAALELTLERVGNLVGRGADAAEVVFVLDEGDLRTEVVGQHVIGSSRQH